MRRLRGRVDNGGNMSCVLFENFAHRFAFSNIAIVMLVVTDGRDELIAGGPGGSFGTKEPAPHIVVDSKNALPCFREVLYGLRADQTRGPAHNHGVWFHVPKRYSLGRLPQYPGD